MSSPILSQAVKLTAAIERETNGRRPLDYELACGAASMISALVQQILGLEETLARGGPQDTPAVEAEMAEIIYRYVEATIEEEDVGEQDFDECWSLEQICKVIAKRAISIVQSISINDLARALFAALDHGSTDALMDGDPLEASYFEGELISGVLLDGRFDMRKAAVFLLRCLGTLRNAPVELSPGTYILKKTISLTAPEWETNLRKALRPESSALQEWASETLGNLLAIAEQAHRLAQRLESINDAGAADE